MDQAKDILKNERIEKLPLVDDKNQIAGLYTTQDILNIENYKYLEEGHIDSLELALFIASIEKKY